MFDPTRLIATCVYLGSILLTLVAALVFKVAALVILCGIVQYLAMIWYALSYVPFARQAVIGCLKGLFTFGM
jgi:hypothetical protein